MEPFIGDPVAENSVSSTHQRYLTHHKKIEVTRQIEEIRSEYPITRSLKWKLLLLPSLHQQHRNITECLNRVENWVTRSDEYNKEFVERQLDRSQPFFEEIGEEALSLDTQQRRAVVRNDTYNRVIAAAGTGKTLVLTARVAYLVKERGVPPDQVAAITFTNKAAEEMETRLEEEFSITDVTVDTIHGFALDVVQEGSNVYMDVADQESVENFVRRELTDHLVSPESDLHYHYLQFLSHYDESYVTEFNSDSWEEYVASRQSESYKTLAGERVASRAEKTIADFLLTHGIEYQYEALVDEISGSDDKSRYTPDFHLPDHEIYIEHWGLDEGGEVAPWFSVSSEEYIEDLEWKRNEFSKIDPVLVETYDFEYQLHPEHIRTVLEDRLSTAGVDVEPLGMTELSDYLKEQHRDSKIRTTFREFIWSAKTFDIQPNQIKSRLNPENPRQYHFALCGAILMEHYEKYLGRNDMVDFIDMIDRGTTTLSLRPELGDEYSHILVDEFQDVSQRQIEFIKRLAGPNDARLFSVGDDWQSIYGFRAANVELFTQFEQEFGPATTSDLTQSYRCPPQIVDAGNLLIAKNQNQTNKRVTGLDSNTSVDPIKWHAIPDSENREEMSGAYAAEQAKTYISEGANPDEILILCRYDDATQHLDAVKTALADRGIPYWSKNERHHPSQTPDWAEDEFEYDTGVDVQSIHKVKGKEAEHVILLNAVEGDMGFPDLDRGNELTQPVNEPNVDPIAEERRLFYVALTRAKTDLLIQTQRDEESRFVEEIQAFATEITLPTPSGNYADRGHDEFVARVILISKTAGQIEHQAGELYDGDQTLSFTSWADENPPTVEEGSWYEFENVTIQRVNNEPQLVIHGETELTELQEQPPEHDHTSTSDAPT
ncbi:UvrD-helicase domain-containing protein [Halostagnicola bangensis]